MSHGAVESAANAFGIGTTITLGGREFVMNPVAAEVYGMIERHLESLADDPFDIIKKKLVMFDNQPKVQAEMIAQALAQSRQVYRASIVEVSQYMQSFDGTVFIIWCMIRGDSDVPEEYTCSREFVKDAMLETVNEAMAQNRTMGEVLDDYHTKIDKVSGEGLAGNSLGPTSTGKSTSQEQPASTIDPNTTSDAHETRTGRA